MYDFIEFMTEPVKEIMEEIVDMAKKEWSVEGFKMQILEKFKS